MADHLTTEEKLCKVALQLDFEMNEIDRLRTDNQNRGIWMVAQAMLCEFRHKVLPNKTRWTKLIVALKRVLSTDDLARIFAKIDPK